MTQDLVEFARTAWFGWTGRPLYPWQKDLLDKLEAMPEGTQLRYDYRRKEFRMPETIKRLEPTRVIVTHIHGTDREHPNQKVAEIVGETDLPQIVEHDTDEPTPLAVPQTGPGL